MPARQADAIILRTYPLREIDRLVTFFSRQFGKCRGVGHGAARSQRRFGAALQPLTQVRVSFFERPNQELVSLERCEVVATMWPGSTEYAAPDYARSVALGYIAEIADKLLPDREVNDAAYRLLAAVLAALREGGPPWLPLLYDLYWMVRLGGFLPDLESAPLSEDNRYWGRMLAKTSLAAIPAAGWESSAQAAGLRSFLHAQLEQHLEQRVRSWNLLNEL
ncbi:MAG: DNA repair protein RecO [Terriglobales bacterium]